MNLKLIITFSILILLFAGMYAFSKIRVRIDTSSSISLPEPRLKGEVSVEEAIHLRRSRRDFESTPVSLNELSQLLWSAQGITSRRGFRASPSAGAAYPLELYVIAGGVEGIKPGVYHYVTEDHTLRPCLDGDIRGEIARVALDQNFILNAPLSIVIVADYSRTTSRYGDRGRRYVHMEVGHVGENLYLQATSLGLGTVAVGAFRDDEIKRLLVLPKNLEPLYIMPFGHTR